MKHTKLVKVMTLLKCVLKLGMEVFRILYISLSLWMGLQVVSRLIKYLRYINLRCMLV